MGNFADNGRIQAPSQDSHLERHFVELNMASFGITAFNLIYACANLIVDINQTEQNF
jgi:hypothetical protein